MDVNGRLHIPVALPFTTYSMERSTSLSPYHLLLTPWSGVLLEKLTGFQPVKKSRAFYRTLRFITAFTSARHLSLS